MGPEAYYTISEFASMAKILADAGYTCGLSGKWHLGDNLEPQEGFTFWITKPHGHTRTFHDAEVIEEGRSERSRLPHRIFGPEQGHASSSRRTGTRPFFLFLAYNGPYGLGASMQQPARNRHAATYADQEMPSFRGNQSIPG